jgi:hypothetical protein
MKVLCVGSVPVTVLYHSTDRPSLLLYCLLCLYNIEESGTAIVGFEVLTAVSMKFAVFWVVAPCSLVEVYQCFRGPCCLHHQGDE